MSFSDAETLEEFERRLGTHSSMFGRVERIGDGSAARLLVEDLDFWRRGRERVVHDVLGAKAPPVTCIPPGFLSDRRHTVESAAEAESCLRAVGEWTERSRTAPTDLETEINEDFADVPATVPVGEALDSIGNVEFSLLLEKYGMAFDPKLRLCDYLGMSGDPKNAPTGPVLKIVSLQDGVTLPTIDASFLEALAARVGVPVHFEHLCVPPSPVLWSDIVFHDHFLPRADAAPYTPVVECIRKIHNADMVIMDDVTEFYLPDSQFLPTAYPRLSHSFRNDEQSDLLALRLQRYASSHHLVPTEILNGKSIPLEARADALEAIGEYLTKPILKIALCPEYVEHTSGWDVERRSETSARFNYKDGALTAETLIGQIATYVSDHRDRIVFSNGVTTNIAIPRHQPHFCSWLIKHEAVSFLIDRYESFCLLGSPSSVPSLATRAREAGKSVVHHGNLELPSQGYFDCVVLTGVWGVPETTAPMFPLVFSSIGASWKPLNVDRELAEQFPFPVWNLSKGPQST